MTYLDSVLKAETSLCWHRSILSNYGFSVFMYRCEWNHKEVWEPKNYAFEMCCWRKLLRVLWTAKKSNQSILNEINSEYSLEGLILKLKLQEFGHLMWKADSLEKTLTLRKIEGRRRSWQRLRWLQYARLNGYKFEQTRGDGGGQSSLVCCSPWGHKEPDRTEQLN